MTVPITELRIVYTRTNLKEMVTSDESQENNLFEPKNTNVTLLAHDFLFSLAPHYFTPFFYFQSTQGCVKYFMVPFFIF